MSDSAAAFGDSDADIKAAAETLQSVERMRRRTQALARSRQGPLWVWAASFALALPISLIGSTAALAAASVATMTASVISILDYRRQPVHPARERRSISVAEGILFAIMFVLFSPLLITKFALVAVSPSVGLAGASFMAVLVGRHIRNRALLLAGVASLFGLVAAPFIWTDQSRTIAAASYVLAFSIGGIALGRNQRKNP